MAVFTLKIVDGNKQILKEETGEAYAAVVYEKPYQIGRASCRERV